MPPEKTFSRAIVHVDGDAFFAYCEVAQNERLRGKPVVVGQEKGMAIAVSYEAKARGVSRGMLMSQAKEICPDLIILTSHYDLYRVYALRMYTIVRRYSREVEEYSVDECFADITREGKCDDDYIAIARKIKRDLEQDLGMTFSIGLAPTKVLAKVASKTQKPAGFTVIRPHEAEQFLEKIPVGKIWGIGPASSISLNNQNIRTALDLARKPDWWVEEKLAKPYKMIWHELNGRSVSNVHTEFHDDQKSIMKTGTFRPPTKNPTILKAELAKNTERACNKLRRHGWIAKELSFYLKTQTFRYRYVELALPIATSSPLEVLRLINKHFLRAYNAHELYRATGVILRGIRPQNARQNDLFGASAETDRDRELYRTIDKINLKYGRSAVMLAQSLPSQNASTGRIHLELKYTTALYFGIPYWGEVG